MSFKSDRLGTGLSEEGCLLWKLEDLNSGPLLPTSIKSRVWPDMRACCPSAGACWPDTLVKDGELQVQAGTPSQENKADGGRIGHLPSFSGLCTHTWAHRWKCTHHSPPSPLSSVIGLLKPLGAVGEMSAHNLTQILGNHRSKITWPLADTVRSNHSRIHFTFLLDILCASRKHKDSTLTFLLFI